MTDSTRMSENTVPRPIVGALNVYGILALAGIVGPVVLIVTDLIAAISQPGYDFMRNSISSLAWAPLGWVQSIGFLAIGLLVEIFSAGLFFSIRGARGFRPGIALLVCFGFGLLLLGAFREDLAGSPHTTQGIIHAATAATVFCIFPIASLLIALSLRRDPYWKKLYLHTVIMTSLTVAFVIGHLFLSAHHGYLGLDERLLVANILIWVEIMAIRLLRLSLSAPEKLKRPTIF